MLSDNSDFRLLQSSSNNVLPYRLYYIFTLISIENHEDRYCNNKSFNKNALHGMEGTVFLYIDFTIDY